MKRKLLVGSASLVVLGIIIYIVIPKFEVSNLNVGSGEVKPGETVIITAEVQNVGKIRGTHDLELKVDGRVEQSEAVTLDGGDTTSASFCVERHTVGSYDVELGGQTSIFRVVDPETLTVHFVDVGQGDSILIDLGDTEVLIDGGDKSPGVVSYIDH